MRRWYSRISIEDKKREERERERERRMRKIWKDGSLRVKISRKVPGDIELVSL